MNLPLSRLAPIQSLGWLESGQPVRCIKDIAGFSAGKSYPIRQFPIIVRRGIKRPAVTGPDHEYQLTGRDLCFALPDDWGKDRLFIDRRHIGQGITIVPSDPPELPAEVGAFPAAFRAELLRAMQSDRQIHPHFDLEALIEHFDITPPPEIAQANRELFEWNVKFLKAVEQIIETGFHWKSFQAEDLASVSIPDGAIYAGEPGTGKTPMGIGWALLKVGPLTPDLQPLTPSLTPAAPVLIVCPGSLMRQMQADYASLFGRAWPGVTRIDCQATLFRLLAKNRGRLAPGFYMSSYQEIALNKFQLLPKIEDGNLTDSAIRCDMDFFDVQAPTPAEGLAMCRAIARETAIGLDTERDGIRCVYRPALADLLHDQLAAVIIDEAVHCKGEHSIIGLGVRRLNARYRLVLTGTPIKNRLPDILFLAAWACDALDKPNERWPYSAGSLARFVEEFQVHSIAAKPPTLRGLLRSQYSITPSLHHSAGNPIAEISNLNKLWTVLAPVVLRRRKCDIPEEEIVPKIYRTVTVPMGIEQARVYQHQLQKPYHDRRGHPAVGAKIMALRSAAAAPCSESLGKVRSAMPFTPKVRACLEVVRAVLDRREQVVIFSPFHEPLDVLTKYLTEAGIPHDVLDGRISQQKRAQLAMNFKLGLMPSFLELNPFSPYFTGKSNQEFANPVLLAGLKACAEGFSWSLCNNVILFAPEQALDLMRQAVDRVHRINSPKPVNVWSLPVAGSIEERMYAMLDEKGTAADIALDGIPAAFATEEMHLADLLKIAQSEFTREGLIDEETCLAAWPGLRQALANAWEGRA